MPGKETYHLFAQHLSAIDELQELEILLRRRLQSDMKSTSASGEEPYENTCNSTNDISDIGRVLDAPGSGAEKGQEENKPDAVSFHKQTN